VWVRGGGDMSGSGVECVGDMIWKYLEDLGWM
jgi:hypothetical protein